MKSRKFKHTYVCIHISYCHTIDTNSFQKFVHIKSFPKTFFLVKAFIDQMYFTIWICFAFCGSAHIIQKFSIN